MKEQVFDPHRLDVRAFARAGADLAGRWQQSSLPRLSEGLLPLADGAPAVEWTARGEQRELRGGAAQVWLHLTARTRVSLECQRCLMPMLQALEVDRHFLFARDEAEAARLDEESEDDVLVMARHLDLAGLVEDELILALPIVPRHEACPEPLSPLPEEAPAADEPRENPFAALAALRRRTTD
jgi:uncharacterized protein